MRTEVTTKRIDGKAVLWGYTVDPTAEIPKDAPVLAYISQRWVILGVYADEQEAYQAQKKYSIR